MKLQQQLGRHRTRALVERFHALRLDKAIATSASRQQLAATFDQFEKAIERTRPVRVSDECRKNPSAAGCT